MKVFSTIVQNGLAWNPEYRCEFCNLSLVLAPGQENGDNSTRNQMEGFNGDILRIHCEKCWRAYFALEGGGTAKIHWD